MKAESNSLKAESNSTKAESNSTKAESNSLIDVLNNIVKGYKDIKLDGLTEPSKVTVAYRSIFGEYKDIDKEIIAEQLSKKKEGESEKEGKWKAFYNFLKDRDCLWMDLIGCDSFSDKIKKQIFFATISMNDDVANQRSEFLKAYKEKIKSIPIDLFIQLFFIDRERLLDDLKTKGSVEEETIKNLGDRLDKIQSNGFVLSFSSKQKNNESLVQNNESFVQDYDDYPLILNVSVESFNGLDDFEKEIKIIDVQKNSFPLEIKDLLKSFDASPLSFLSTLIARFNKSLHSQIKFLYFVPIHCPDGSVGLFCYGSKAEDLLKSDTIDELRLLSYNLLYPYVSSYKSAWESKRVIKESIKSAKAAIISRNLSHNLGSHVMFYIKQKLESVGKIMETGALRELINSHSVDEIKKKIENKIALGDEIEMPFLVGLGRFLNYLQERQDFIATVATNYIPYSTVINFKDAIYDELKPEKRYERHKSPETKGKQPANLLLDYIAYSEGFNSSNDIELWFGEEFDGSGKPETVPSSLREFNVALPGGNMGRQAFFSIMENIIRNTAKHDGSKADNGKLRFRFKKLDNEDDIKNITRIDGYCLREGETYKTDDGYCLCEGEVDKDNILPLDRSSVYQKSQNDFYYLGINVELNESKGDADDAIKELKKGLRRAYITSDFQMDEECKGLKEIRISAAWLRGRELDDEIPSNEPPAVAIRKTKEGHLQYIICLPKPKLVAFVKNYKAKDFVNKDKNYEYLKKDGCRVFSKDEKVQTLAEYDLVVVEQEIPDKEFKQIQSHVGSRVLRCAKEKMDRILKGSNVVEEAYKKWLPNTLHIEENNLPKISILDGLNSTVEVVESIKDNIRNSGTSEKDKSYFKDCIVFNTHYPGQPFKNEEDRVLYAQASFVEAISGGNSTDRLIRHDKRDYEWYAKHVIAGKTKVAIFDERIYDMVMPKIEVVKLSDEEIKCITDEVAQYCMNNPNADFASKIDFVESMIQTKDADFAALLIRSSKNSDGSTDERKLTDQILNYRNRKNNNGDYSKAWKYRESGIWVFNIKTNEKYKTVQIIGYSAPVVDPIGLFDDKYQEEVLATIRMDGSTIIIEPKENEELKRFDFLTIHQGILDKIYSTLDIKKDRRKCVTQILYSYFIKPDTNSIPDPEQGMDDNGYLPHVIIHSGRSKPNKNDMPQHLPFLQFSALDHAVRDCKYTLTELLYSSHYE